MKRVLYVFAGIVACTPSQPPEVAASGEEAAPIEAVKSATGQAAGVERTYPAHAPIRVDELAYSPDFARLRRAEVELERENWAAAMSEVSGLTTPAAALIRARAHRGLQTYPDALGQLEIAAKDATLADLVRLERGLTLAAAGKPKEAVTTLGPLVDAKGALASAAIQTYVAALKESDPQVLLDRFAAAMAALPEDDIDARSELVEQKAAALDRLGRTADARQVRLERYLEHPVSSTTPTEPPSKTLPSHRQLLARAEVLLDAHRNPRVIAALEELPESGLTPDEVCRRRFALGLAHRKERHYASAEKHLTFVVKKCADDDLARRAMYLNAKVISIVNGLRAIPVIDAFAKRFAGHTMVDDVYFWAGDMYQRRGKPKEALDYYGRIETLQPPGDHCADARWRIAWMSYRKGDMQRATRQLERAFSDDGCVTEAFDRARAGYWLARIAQDQKDNALAAQRFRKVVETQPLGYYSQLSLKHLFEIDPDARAAMTQTLAAPGGNAVPALCPGWMAEQPAFERALTYLTAGLGHDAAAELRSIAPPEQTVVGKSHAVNQGVKTTLAEQTETTTAVECAGGQPELLLTLLLDKAGAHREAHWRLRTEFKELLDALPTPADVGLFRAAYPMAYRDELQAAELESGIPRLFLQSLSREESAFNAEVVSWAGAYGLTQLLLSSGKTAGRLLEPPVKVETADELLDPALNARLGGALMGSLLERYKGNPALGLVAYNAGERVADGWWRRHQTKPFDLFVEEMTIRETRGYVKRVLKTYGIYKWLYDGDAPELPIAMTVPAK